jgi:predicted nucleic acid-binding protein
VLYVIDANVAAKWFIPESDSSIAEQLLDRYTQGTDEFIAPDLIVSEVANVLWKRSLSGDIGVDQAFNSMEAFLSFGIPLTPSSDLAVRALEMAVRYRLPAYYMLYLVLAFDRGCDFITADTRFFNATSAAFPQVKLLSNWQPSVP